MTSTRRVVVLIAHLSLLAAGARAVDPIATPGVSIDPQKAFDELYGEQWKRVTGTPDKRDDVALARQMFDAAKALPQEKAEDRHFKAFLLARTYELGARDPAGYDTAESAARLMPQVDAELDGRSVALLLDLAEARFRSAKPGPDRDRLGRAVTDDLLRTGADLLRERRVAEARKLFDRAERVGVIAKSPRGAMAVSMLRIVDARLAVARAIAELGKDAEARKRKQTARKLVLLNALELDDPDEAAKYLADADDAELSRVIPLAAKPATDLSAAQCMELGRWYLDCRSGPGLSVSGVSVCLSRAKELLSRYLRVQPVKNLEALRVGQWLREIGETFEKDRDTKAVVLPRRRNGMPYRPVAVASDRPEIAEAGDLIDEVSDTYPDALAGARQARLMFAHDAAAFRLYAGGAKAIPGAYSGKPVEGANGFIWAWGVYQDLPPGRYVVLYRIQPAGKLAGANVAFLDVCTGGNTIAERRPDGRELAPGEWRALPVQLKLGGRTTVEYRLWTNNNTLALDRVYVFALTPP